MLGISSDQCYLGQQGLRDLSVRNTLELLILIYHLHAVLEVRGAVLAHRSEVAVDRH